MSKTKKRRITVFKSPAVGFSGVSVEKLSEKPTSPDTESEEQAAVEPEPIGDPVECYTDKVVLIGFSGHMGVNSRGIWRGIKSRKP